MPNVEIELFCYECREKLDASNKCNNIIEVYPCKTCTDKSFDRGLARGVGSMADATRKEIHSTEESN